MSGQGTTRRRRTREEARNEILDAAERLLADAPLRDLRVDELMATTTLRRPSFYVYFADRGELMVGLLERVESQMFQGAGPWFKLSATASREDAIEALGRGIRQVTEVFAEHGALIAAIGEAAVMDESVERAYRGGTVQILIDATRTRMEAEVAAGRAEIENPAELANALVLMNESYSREGLGRAHRKPVDEISEALIRIWISAIYGARP